MQFLDSVNYDVVEPNLTQPMKAAKMLPNPTRGLTRPMSISGVGYR